MADVKKEYFCCDKCGKKEEVSIEKVWEQKTGKGMSKIYNGWVVIGENYCLCQDCKKPVFKEIKRHKKRLKEIIGNNATSDLLEAKK